MRIFNDQTIPALYQEAAEGHYFCNVCRFLSVGEGREISKMEAGRIKREYSEVEDWFESIPREGKQRVIAFLACEYENALKAKQRIEEHIQSQRAALKNKTD